jgi:hypothetical protein
MKLILYKPHIKSIKQPYGGFQKWGYPNSWMVLNGKPKHKMDDVGVMWVKQQ